MGPPGIYELVIKCSRSTFGGKEPKRGYISKNIDDILYDITKCEEIAPTHVIILSPKAKKGIIFKVVMDEDEGLVPIAIHTVYVEKATASWEAMIKITADCRDFRIFKDSELVLFICKDKIRYEKLLPDMVCDIINSDDVFVYCLHDWGD